MEVLWGADSDMKKNIKSYRDTYLGRNYLPPVKKDE
jgi:hypothetical protein